MNERRRHRRACHRNDALPKRLPGGVGTQVARTANALGMRVVATRNSGPPRGKARRTRHIFINVGPALLVSSHGLDKVHLSGLRKLTAKADHLSKQPANRDVGAFSPPSRIGPPSSGPCSIDSQARIIILNVSGTLPPRSSRFQQEITGPPGSEGSSESGPSTRAP
jgi:hypothetical protein